MRVLSSSLHSLPEYRRWLWSDLDFLDSFQFSFYSKFGRMAAVAFIAQLFSGEYMDPTSHAIVCKGFLVLSQNVNPRNFGEHFCRCWLSWLKRSFINFGRRYCTMSIYLVGLPILVIFHQIATFLFSIYYYTNLNPKINLLTEACGLV